MLTANHIRRSRANPPAVAVQPVAQRSEVDVLRDNEQLNRELARLREALVAMERRAVKAEQLLASTNEELLLKAEQLAQLEEPSRQWKKHKHARP